MACASQPGPAAFIGYINEHYGERVTQSDWHAVRMLAEAETGRSLTRSRANKASVEKIADYLVKADGGDVDSSDSQSFKAKLMETENTEGTLATVSYLSRYGVSETLSKVRQKSKPVRASEFAVGVEIVENGVPRQYNYVVESEEALASLVGDIPKHAQVNVSAKTDEGYKDLSPTEIDNTVRAGAVSNRERNTVIPDTTSYSVSMEAVAPNGAVQVWNGHIESLDKLREHVAGSTGVRSIKIAENRSGYTLAEPDRRQTQMVDLTDEEVKNLLAD